jgi:hypothetical protein
MQKHLATKPEVPRERPTEAICASCGDVIEDNDAANAAQPRREELEARIEELEARLEVTPEAEVWKRWLAWLAEHPNVYLEGSH